MNPQRQGKTRKMLEEASKYLKENPGQQVVISNSSELGRLGGLKRAMQIFTGTPASFEDGRDDEEQENDAARISNMSRTIKVFQRCLDAKDCKNCLLSQEVQINIGAHTSARSGKPNWYGVNPCRIIRDIVEVSLTDGEADEADENEGIIISAEFIEPRKLKNGEK